VVHPQETLRCATQSSVVATWSQVTMIWETGKILSLVDGLKNSSRVAFPSISHREARTDIMTQIPLEEAMPA
jgi:hypothetical protein